MGFSQASLSVGNDEPKIVLRLGHQVLLAFTYRWVGAPEAHVTGGGGGCGQLPVGGLLINT